MKCMIPTAEQHNTKQYWVWKLIQWMCDKWNVWCLQQNSIMQNNTGYESCIQSMCDNWNVWCLHQNSIIQNNTGYENFIQSMCDKWNVWYLQQNSIMQNNTGYESCIQSMCDNWNVWYSRTALYKTILGMKSLYSQCVMNEMYDAYIRTA